jgi:hypothetical protein
MARARVLILVATVAMVAAAGCVQRADPDDAALERVLSAEPDPNDAGDDEAGSDDDEAGSDDDAAGSDDDDADEPEGYGDDPRLDAIQDDCEGGELRACDLLFMETTEGTDYEHVALTCGGTTEVSATFCTPEPELDETGFAPADSPGLQVLASDCKDGDLTACDLLYLLVPEGHDLEDVGLTCVGRVAGGAYPDCRTQLG